MRTLSHLVNMCEVAVTNHAKYILGVTECLIEFDPHHEFYE